MGTRTDNAHLAAPHVVELGQLVDARATQEVAKFRHPGVALSGLQRVAVGVDTHRAELVAIEGLPAVACALLDEEDWAWR